MQKYQMENESLGWSTAQKDVVVYSHKLHTSQRYNIVAKKKKADTIPESINKSVICKS